MTAESKSLVERLGWHHEHPVTGKMVLVNPDGPEAAAEIDMLRNLVDERTNDAAKEWERAERLEREKEEAARENIDMMWQRRRADERAEAAEQLAEERLEHIAALESELTRLKSPMEGAKTTAEELVAFRERLTKSPGWLSGEDSLRLLDDLDHATAQARSAADADRVMDQLYALVKRYREDTPLGHQPHMISAEVEKVLKQADAIRARRKGKRS